MKPWFIKEGDVIPFPKKDDKVIKLPNVGSYPNFLAGVEDLQSRVKQGELSDEMYKKLYTELLHRFMRRESAETPWFMKEGPTDNREEIKQLKSELDKKAPGFVIDKLGDGSGYRLKHGSMTADEFNKRFPEFKIQQVDTSKGDPMVTGGGRGYDKPGHKGLYNNSVVYFAFRKELGDISTQKTDKNISIVAPKSKSLTPSKLGLQPNYQGLDNLYKDVLDKITKNFDGAVGEILQHILKNAINKSAQKDLPDNLQKIFKIGSIYKPISQDFGEVLAPFILGKKSDTVNFPVGNEPIVDVKLPGMDLAVKSLSGSGNSFIKIKELFNSFESTIDEKDTKTRAKFGMYKIFSQKVKGQKVEDQIVYGSHYAQNPEMVELTRRAGKMKLTNKAELKNAVKKLVINKQGQFISYEKFEQLVKEIGGVSGKVFGLPKGGSSTGIVAYKKNPLEYATLSFIYMLGKGLENMVLNGADKGSYGEILNKIMRQVNAYAGFVTISNTGIISVELKPFKDLNFKFDYHAYTSNPGNNRPGFAIIR